MTYDELLIKQKSLLDRSRICLNNGDYSSFNKIMNDFTKLADDFINYKYSYGDKKVFVYELEIVFKRHNPENKIEYFSSLENALERKEQILNGDSKYDSSKIVEVYVYDEPVLKSVHSF